MANRIDRFRFEIEVDVLASTNRVVGCNYQVGDTVETDLGKMGGLADRDITAGELSGSLQSFIDAMKAASESDAGIS